MPNEILIRIFEYVKGWTPDPRYDTYMYGAGTIEIKKLRLTCWRFCNNSSQLLLPLLKVEMSSASVARLNTISQHPTIGKGIRAVRVSLDYYDHTLAAEIALFAEFSASELRKRTHMSELSTLQKIDGSVDSDLEHIRTSREFEILCTIFANKHVDEATMMTNPRALSLLRRAHEEYRSRLTDQAEVMEDRGFVRSVATAIGRMPLVTRLEFVEWDFEGSHYRQRGSSREGDDDYYLRQMLLPMRWGMGRKWALSTPHGDLLVDLPIAIHETGNVLEGLDLEISSLPEPQETLTRVKTQRFSVAIQRVKNLKIRMRDGDLADSPSSKDPAYLKHCHRYITALSNTPNIEKIFLDLECFTGRDIPPLTYLGSLMTFRSWENLRIVTWFSISVRQADIKRFFRLMQKPLRIFHLQGVHLLGGSWAETLEILRDAPTGHCVELNSPEGAECEILGFEEKSKVFEKPDRDIYGHSPAEAYILGYSEHNPLKPVDNDQNDTSQTQ